MQWPSEALGPGGQAQNLGYLERDRGTLDTTGGGSGLSPRPLAATA